MVPGAGVMATALVIWACFCGSAWAFSQGAPDTACATRIPKHGVGPQNSPPPYTITPGSVQVQGGERMLVTLQVAGNTVFKGFIIQARASDTQKVTGTFFTTDHKYLNCDNGMNNAVTHKGPADKTKVTLMWEPPSDFAGDVVFVGSFVLERTSFWVDVTSEKINVTKRAVAQEAPVDVTPAPTSTTTSTSTTTTTTTSTTTTTTTTSSPSVILDSNAVGAKNAGDFVISVVDAPGSDVVKNDNSLNKPDKNDNLSTLAPFPTSISTSPQSSTVNPGSPVSDSSTNSSRTSPVGTSEGEGVTEEEEVIGDQDGTEEGGTTEGTGRTPPRRRFGLLGRKKNTPAAAATTSTTTSTTTETTASRAPSVPSQDLSPEAQSLEMALVNIYDTCELEKGCFGFPPGCEANKKCDMMVTYSTVSSSGYKFEIMGTISSGYVASGLSDDEHMGRDSVVACRNLNGKMDVLMAYNTDDHNEFLANPKYGISDIKTLQVNGKVYCTFVRQPRTEIKNIVFDLDKDTFHLMLAAGPAEESKLRYHDNRIVSSGTVSMHTFASVGVSSEIFKTLHACFMIGAWICAASCGIIFARYYKTTWLSHRSCGIDQWFHFHRLFMMLTWSLTVAGFILIAYYLKGWTRHDPKENPHAIIGIISVGLCFLQPFIALCRCAPTSRNRPLFNWLHWFIGNCAQILGITAIFFGFPLINGPEWTTFILIIFIAFHCLIHLILSIGQCVSDSKAERMSNVYPMKEMNGSRNPLHPTEKRTDAPGGGFRKAMLALYFLVNWVITAVLIIIVIAGEKTLKEWGIIFWEK
ncbi:putative ferric-chelate reductase 1 homolog isoform X1 [Procambarus clarkii]|uniref:putative ferric-chelate reductase 1 homolog isoform X1 n=1 Tax=Procambarus clarkii TaxID=6728 RepID=UPI001E6771BD|nr:putative ferric-chelate reductase 1 homolog isoform X1 [Procambarus clarkii]